jgi:O-antigen/teichoic acid export membrane protein
MNWLNKHLSLKADLMVTLLNGVIVIGGVFVLNGLIARIHGLDVLGEFLLIKRTLSASVGILLVGMNIALPNYLSRNFEKSYGDNAFILFLIITVPMTILLIAGILLFNIKGFYSNHFWIYVLFSLGLSAQFITYALYRGYMNMVGANVFQLLGTAIIPIVVFTSVAKLNDGLFLIGCSVTTIMVFAFLFRNKGIHLAAITFHHSKKIIIYGIERVPSFVAQFILLAGVPIYLAQKVNFESVAYFNSSLSLVRLALLIVNPIGMVLLPRISNKIATGSVDEVNNMLNILFKAGLFLSVIGTIYCYINAPLILNFWLGTVNVSGVNILRLTILALPFYTFAGLSRSPIDAVSEKGYNSLIYSLAAIVMIAIIFIGKIFDCDFLETALTSFLISHIIAGLASAYFIQRLYKSKLWNFKIMRDIVGGVLIVYLINHLLSFAEISGLSQLIIGSAIYLVIGVIVFKFVKSGWIADLKTIMYAR